MKDKIIYFIVIAAVVICGFAFVTSKEEAVIVESTDSEVLEETEEQSSLEETLSDIIIEDTMIYVYICGSVNSPGVYEVPLGTRVFNVIELAGGAMEEADLLLINLADTVSDGQKIYIPEAGESISSYDEIVSGSTLEDDSSSGLVNINTADKETLMTIPGIGEAKANAIISYREDGGSFSCIEDVMNVSGIKEAAFSKMKDYICTN